MLTAPEYRSADQVRVEDWEKLHNRRFTDVLRLFDVAVAQLRESPEGWGFSAEACIEGFSIRLEASPPARVGGERRGGGPAVFSRDNVQAAVMEYPDLLALKEEEGGRVTVSTKKYLDKEWEAVNGRLREAGMRYVRENRRWEQA